MPSTSSSEEPTNEQLANFACVIVEGPGFSKFVQKTVVRMFEETPLLRERWLEYHADFQKKANELGDALAQEDDSV